jgi:Uma2 family endonuclease
MSKSHAYFTPEEYLDIERISPIKHEYLFLYPTLIVEVLSDSTEAFDRGDKFADYKTIPTLTEYLLIHQSQMLVERFQRRSENLWVPQIYRDGDTIELSSINFSGPIGALYENIAQLS